MNEVLCPSHDATNTHKNVIVASLIACSTIPMFLGETLDLRTLRPIRPDSKYHLPSHVDIKQLAKQDSTHKISMNVTLTLISMINRGRKNP